MRVFGFRFLTITVLRLRLDKFYQSGIITEWACSNESDIWILRGLWFESRLISSTHRRVRWSIRCGVFIVATAFGDHRYLDERGI